MTGPCDVTAALQSALTMMSYCSRPAEQERRRESKCSPTTTSRTASPSADTTVDSDTRSGGSGGHAALGLVA